MENNRRHLLDKEKIKTILIVLITLILGLNVGVYAAYAFSAIDVSYTNSSGSTISVAAALNELYLKVPKYEVGDEVTVGGEQFYVLNYSRSSETVDLFAKYCLNSTFTAQDADNQELTTSLGMYPMTTDNSSNNINDLYSADPDSSILGNIKQYGNSKGSICTRFLTYNEAYSYLSNNSTKSMMWSQGINFWLGTIADKYEMYYYDYNNNEIRSYDVVDLQAGLRPVLTMNKSVIK